MTRPGPVAFVVALVVTAVAGTSAVADGRYDRLLPYVPPDANVLVLVDVKGVYDSPVGRREKWAEEYKDRYRSGVGLIPPGTGAVVIGSVVNLSAMSRDHQVGVIGSPLQQTVKYLAERDGGTTTEIAGRPFALSPRDAYLATLSAPATVALYPADRQAAARWSRHAAGAKAPALSPYLAAAVGKAAGSAVTVAVDLTESQDPTLLRLGLSVSPVVVAAKISAEDVSRIARFISSAKGLTFSAAAGEGVTGSVTVEFREQTVIFRPLLRELFLELLDEYGVAIPGVAAWEASYGPGSMTLAGPLAPADLRRVLSLFAFPGTADEGDPAARPGEVTAAATTRYWAAMNTVLADLRGQKDSKDYTKTATWHDKAAAQLDHLNPSGVDPLARRAADESARRLKAIAQSLRGVPIDTKALEEKGYYTVNRSWSAYPGWGGWWGRRGLGYSSSSTLDTNYYQIRGEIAKVVAADQKKRLDTWAQIDQILSDTRRQLSEKYKGGF